MAGKVGSTQQIAKLGDEKSYPGFSVQDGNGAPVLTLTFDTVEAADACRIQMASIIQKARSVVDFNGKTR
jgi:hypothetical protein